MPQPVNLFEKTTVQPDGTLTWHPAASRWEDHVQLRTELDCLVVVSACPYDLAPTIALGGLANDLL